MSEFTRVALTSEIPEGTGKSIRVDGKSIAVFNVGGEFHAIDDVCPHMGGPLGDGPLQGDHVLCPWHGWMFCVKTGKFASNPNAGVDTFSVKVDGEEILVEL